MFSKDLNLFSEPPVDIKLLSRCKEAQGNLIDRLKRNLSLDTTKHVSSIIN